MINVLITGRRVAACDGNSESRRMDRAGNMRKTMSI
jgi:hypothetical protein